jgi:hypothetical protein
MRARRGVVTFITCVAPSFARCRCGADLAGLRAWRWRNPDGTCGYGCQLCLFPAHAINAAKSAA